ncbi:hypothetical protein TNCV_1850481 [Trichonephila clavipes]|nr:hypothetical protein TNCV_1850481 [Trichonephila clavipes]
MLLDSEKIVLCFVLKEEMTTNTCRKSITSEILSLSFCDIAACISRNPTTVIKIFNKVMHHAKSKGPPNINTQEDMHVVRSNRTDSS